MGQILRRQPRPRQEAFTPVEAVLCYALFYVVDAHKYGGSSMHRAPATVHDLARLFVRPPGSITNKMMNLDGSRANAGAQEWRFFVELAADADRFPHLYTWSSRQPGTWASPLLPCPTSSPSRHQRARPPRTAGAVAPDPGDRGGRQGGETPTRTGSSEADTARLVEQAVRMGQHRFAGPVLTNFQHACSSAGSRPDHLRQPPARRIPHQPLGGIRRRGTPRPLNGVAACPTHDAAFDTGLITVNGGLRVHVAPTLQASTAEDPGVDRYFGDALHPKLQVPSVGARPAESYLRWHHEHVYQGDLSEP